MLQTLARRHRARILAAQQAALAAAADPHGPMQGAEHELMLAQLHAHLNGSITPETLQAIWEARTAQEGDLGIEAPRTALATRTHAQGIES